jgi:hypothetical protein
MSNTKENTMNVTRALVTYLRHRRKAGNRGRFGRKAINAPINAATAVRRRRCR